MEQTKTWNEQWIELGYKQARMCNENSVGYINFLVKADGIRAVMVEVYNALIRTNRIKKIEDIPIDEKNTLWEQTKEFADNNLNLKETIKLSKCLYAIEYLLT